MMSMSAATADCDSNTVSVPTVIENKYKRTVRKVSEDGDPTQKVLYPHHVGQQISITAETNKVGSKNNSYPKQGLFLQLHVS